MVSLSSAVLFSLVSLAVASSHNGRGHHRHRRQSKCPVRAGGNGTIPGNSGNSTNQFGGSGNSTTPANNGNSITPANSGNSTSKLHLLDHYQGEDFMNENLWKYFTGNDFTNGIVEYVSQATAASQGMAYVSNGAAVLSVNNKTNLPVNTPRPSTRITTTKTYNAGLVIADFATMPYGCSLWPAWWSYNTQNWPIGGEIDVIEGVNSATTNQMTLHTGPNCVLNESPIGGSSSLGFSGNPLSTDCTSSPGNNDGCGIGDPDPSSYGKGFNDNGGGVYARLWDQTGIKIWFFTRASIPQDITSGNPDSSSWGEPVAFWSTNGCDVASHFYDHSLVIDTTLCGDWAGAVYGNSGCPGTCAEAVADASNFDNAYWTINYISVYA